MNRIVQGEGEPRDAAAARAFASLSLAESSMPDETFKRSKREAILENVVPVSEERRSTRSEAIIVKPKLSRSSVIKRAVLVPAVLIVLFVVFTGSAFALSAGANPDSSLYGTKLFFEGFRESLTGSATAKAQLELDYAQKRVQEMQYLGAHNITRGAEGCASAYADNLAQAQARINQLSGDAFTQASAEFLDITGRQLSSLDSLAAQTSGALGPAVERARQTCNGARRGMMDNQQMRMGPGGMQGQPGDSGGGPGGSGGNMMPQDGGQGGGMMLNGSMPGWDGSGGNMLSPDSPGGMQVPSGIPGPGAMSGSNGMPGSGWMP